MFWRIWIFDNTSQHLNQCERRKNDWIQNINHFQIVWIENCYFCRKINEKLHWCNCMNKIQKNWFIQKLFYFRILNFKATTKFNKNETKTVCVNHNKNNEKKNNKKKLSKWNLQKKKKPTNKKKIICGIKFILLINLFIIYFFNNCSIMKFYSIILLCHYHQMCVMIITIFFFSLIN